MKRIILSFAIVSFCSMHVDAKPEIFDRVKAKTSQAWLSTKATAAYVISSVRESNAIKIQRALEAKEAVLKISPLLQINVQGEDMLLQNVQTLGFDKHNALSALTLIERYCADMTSVTNRYNSKIARWNKSEEMESVAQNISSALQVCKNFKLYFQEHKHCLKAWEIIGSYQDVITSWQQHNKLSGMIKSSEALKKDVEKIKYCITKNSFRLAYPNTYKQLHEYLPILECKLDLVNA